MKRINIIIALLFTAIIYSCSGPKGDNIYVKMTDLPAANYLKENPDNYSLWVEMLEYTNYFNTLNINKKYTCFVPDNAAMTAFLAANYGGLVTNIPKDYATTVVKYHIISGVSITNETFSNGVITDSTTSGDLLSLEIREGGINAIYVNNEARINRLDLIVTNGVIHSIDKVLTPITQTVWQKLSENNSYSIFAEAVDKSGYDEILNKITESIQMSPTDVVIKKYKYTLLSVSDQTFAANGITDFNGLCTYLDASSDYESESNSLKKYVGYHIIDNLMSYTQLADFSGLDVMMRNIPTKCDGELINLRDFNSKLYLNYDESSHKGISLEAINNNCKNGIIHTLNNIMPIATPPQSSVIWELTDYPQIASISGTLYRSNTQTAEKNQQLKASAATCYTWQAIPIEEQDNAVKYNVTNKATVEKMKARNSDYLSLKMGTFGWIDITTPLIVKGKYRLKVYHYNTAQKSPAGKVSFFVDSGLVGSEMPLLGNNSKTASYMNKVIGEVTFKDNTTHTLRILSGDGSTTQLDYILFEPII